MLQLQCDDVNSFCGDSFWKALTKHLGMKILRVPGCYVLYFTLYAISLITFKISNLHNKDPNIFAIHTFGQKYCLHPCKTC